MNTVEVLKEAKAVIQDPKHWHQGEFTTERDGVKCFCALGAVAQVVGVAWYSDVLESKAAKLLKEVVKDELPNPQNTFAPWNDSHTHAEVMEAFDKAIALAESQNV